jgi:hypothetical protein
MNDFPDIYVENDSVAGKRCVVIRRFDGTPLMTLWEGISSEQVFFSAMIKQEKGRTLKEDIIALVRTMDTMGCGFDEVTTAVATLIQERSKP